jgi:hypothetical protein
MDRRGATQAIGLWAVIVLSGCAGQDAAGTSGTSEPVKQIRQPSPRERLIGAFVNKSGGIHVDSVLETDALSLEAEAALLRADSVPIVVVGSILDVRRRAELFEVVLETESLLIVADCDSAQAHAVLAMHPRQRYRVAAAVQFRSLRMYREVQSEEATLDETYDGEPLYILREHFGHYAHARLVLMEPLMR